MDFMRASTFPGMDETKRVLYVTFKIGYKKKLKNCCNQYRVPNIEGIKATVVVWEQCHRTSL